MGGNKNGPVFAVGVLYLPPCQLKDTQTVKGTAAGCIAVVAICGATVAVTVTGGQTTNNHINRAHIDLVTVHAGL